MGRRLVFFTKLQTSSAELWVCFFKPAGDLGTQSCVVSWEGQFLDSLPFWGH